jgi:hypothetical protein
MTHPTRASLTEACICNWLVLSLVAINLLTGSVMLISTQVINFGIVISLVSLNVGTMIMLGIGLNIASGTTPWT